jgi:uncharacterized protein with GYD domain
MSIYLWQGTYTAESIAAQIKDPGDRLEAAARPVVEAAGGKLLAGGFSFGEYDVTIVYEAPDDTSAAAIALVVAAGGAVKAAHTTKLLSGAEWVQALRKAGETAKAYRPAR